MTDPIIRTPSPEQISVSPLVIDVPLFELPPSPNRARGMHWAAKGRAAKDARVKGWLAALNTLSRGRMESPDWIKWEPGRCECRIEIIYPTSRRGPMTDPDSALARLKPLIDGLVDAGCLRGDGPNDVAYEPIVQRKEGKQLIVRFTLSEGTEQ